MGLLIKLSNGDTTLKSLIYGKDQLGGGDSGQPFIQTPIGEPEQSGLASSDFILRGGITAPTHAAVDILRLSKFFRTPGGLGFIVKQNILSRVAVETEVGGFLNEGVYNPLSTLVQAGVGFLGGHINKQGLIPGISRKTYEEAAVKNNRPRRNNFKRKNFDNRLLDIWWNKQYTKSHGSILKYGGGPGSLLGIGKTRIQFARDGEGDDLRTGINNSLYSNSNTRDRFMHGGSPRLPTEVDYKDLLGASLKDYYGEYETPHNDKGDRKIYKNLQIEDQSNLTGYNNPRYQNGGTIRDIFLKGYEKALPHPSEIKYKDLLGASLKDYYGEYEVPEYLHKKNVDVNDLQIENQSNKTGKNNPQYTEPNSNTYFSGYKEGYFPHSTTVDYGDLLGASLYYGDYKSPYNPKGYEVDVTDLQIKFHSNLTGYNNPQYENTTTRPVFLKGYKSALPHPSTVDYRNLLGASKEYKVPSGSIAINDKGELQNYYGPHIPGSITIGNDTRFKDRLSTYQVGDDLKNLTTITQTTYKSQILPILEERGRQLLQDTYFSPNTGQYGVVAKPNPTTPLDTYSSKNTLITDPSQIGTEKSGSQAGKPGTTDSQKSTQLNGADIKGYLGNLNKNAGLYDVTSPKSQLDTTPNPNRVGGRGISYDFRQTDRKKRGFSDAYDQPYDYTTPISDPKINGDWKYFDKKTPTLDRIYYQLSKNSDKRTSRLSTSDKDIIPFRIDIINPADLSIVKLNFRAYIDNLSDNYDATWTKQSYMGRAEAFHKYTAFGRDISLGFTVAAESQANLLAIHEQLNTLVSSLAPTYTSYGYMAGNIHKVTIGNYIKEQHGVISNINLEILSESPWSIDKTTDSSRKLPYYLKVSVKFTPIQTFRPEYNGGQFINQA
jgi:hypothetical protein